MAVFVACTTSTDPAMASTAILSSASYCFSGVYRMTGKRDHTEPLVLDTLIVAEPSFLKSPVISAVKRPYTSFTHDWNEQNKTDIFRGQAEKIILESQLVALEKKDDVTADEIADLQTKISNMESSDFSRTCSTALSITRHFVAADLWRDFCTVSRKATSGRGDGAVSSPPTKAIV